MIDNTPRPGPYVFLSYASADRDRALGVADLLEGRGVTVWVDRKSIAGGSSWSAEIVRGIQGSAALLVLCSEAAIRSKNVLQEVQLAWECDRPLLPLLLETVQVPDAMRYALAGRQWIEILDHPVDDWLGIAVRALAGAGLVFQPPTPVAPTAVPDSASIPAQPITPAARPPTLPSPPTALIGREMDLAIVSERLGAADAHLVTLTGPGGIGKTRLAIQLAVDTSDQYPDGVYFVSLAAVVDPALVPTVIAQGLRAPTNPEQTVVDDLKDFLRDRKVLLILDSFEPVLSAAPVVADLLAGAPRLKVLATSRARLQLRGEREYSVPSLSVPEAGRLVPLDQIARHAAIRLFVDRARDVRSDFELTDANASAVAEICRRLDGLPLAIELAAARIKIFPPSTLLARLENRLKLLTGGARDLPVRQQTLRNTIAWSYDLLDESERKLFRSLAVFNGGFTMEAAIAVCSDPEEGDEDAVLAGLASLTDKSLLREIETPTGSGDSESRFRLSQTVRDFALEYLTATPEAGEIERRHAKYYLAFAENVRAASPYSVEPARRHALEREHHNLRAARRWAEETHSDLHARLVDVDDWFASILVATFQAGDVATDYERRLTKARLDGDRPEELRALIGLVEASYVLALDDQTGRASTRARECFVEGERLARSIGDRSALVRLLIASIWFHGFWPEFEEQAERNAREAGELSRDIDDEDLQVAASMVGWRLANREEAESQSRALVRRLTDRGDFARLNAHYFELMWARLLWGDLTGCVEIVETATRLAEQIGIPPVQYATIKALALLNLGRFGEAQTVLQREIADEAHPFGRAKRDLGTANYFFHARAYDRAATMFRDVEERAGQLSRAWMVWWARAGLVASLVRLGRLEAAAMVSVVDDTNSFANRFYQSALSDPRIELALAQKRVDDAHTLAEDVARAAERRDWGLPFVRARETMVRTLLLGEQNQEAIALADATLAQAEEQGSLSLVWQLRAAKAAALEHLGRDAEAVAEYRRAGGIVRVLANSIDDAESRETFLADPEIADIVTKATP